MRDAGRRIARMLVEMDLIEEDQAQQAVEKSEEEGKSFGQSLHELGYVRDPSLLQLLVAQGAASPWILSKKTVDGKVLRLLSPAVCREHTLIPVCRCQELLVIAIANTSDTAAIERVRVLTGLRVEAVSADCEKIRKQLEDSLNENRKADVKKPQAEHKPVQPPVPEQEPEVPEITLEDSVICEDDTAPVVGLVDQIISDAVRREADGILIEPTSNGYDIRYRIEGELRSIGDIPKSLKSLVEARLRLLSKLDIIGTGSPQKGRIEIERSSRKIVFNVDVLPTETGARFLLTPEHAKKSAKRIEDTGIDRESLHMLRQSLEDGEGLILIAASNGEDRAETLYSLLTDLVAPSRDVVSCEDAVAYEITGVSQIRCSSSHLPKSALLRTVLEQCPEVVMVGTLDELCAPYAVRGALSGRLVVASVEANSASKAIARLIDLGVDPYLVSASLKGVLAQRRVRQLCTKCSKKEGSAWRAVGCSECEGSGYKGHVPVFEFLPVSNLVAGLIARKAPLHQLEQIASEDGFRPMRYSALAKVERGTTDMRAVERALGKFEDATLPESHPSVEGLAHDAIVIDTEDKIGMSEDVAEPKLDELESEAEAQCEVALEEASQTAVEPETHLRVEPEPAEALPEPEVPKPLPQIDAHEIHLAPHKDEDLEEHFNLEAYQFRERYKDYYEAS